MLFCSGRYVCFFACVFTVYWTLRSSKLRIAFLLGASFFFYGSWSRPLTALIALSAVVNYILGRVIDGASGGGIRRVLVTVAVSSNLALLCYFKYAAFFLTSIESMLEACGLKLWIPGIRVVLPVGISFYTFEAISYCVDIYTQQIRAERRLGHFLLFVMFFPRLVAGPIVRASDFLPQIQRKKRWCWVQMQLGVQYVVIGMFKKLAIADSMAVYADPVFFRPTEYGSEAVWVAAIAYAVQIYCDFSGYSDIAIGCAHLLGYKLPRNFALPYASTNVGDFWHRWHISLSTWLRDYLFIPLGGSRTGKTRTRVNLVTTMILGGLWHGASWSFALWGMFHGVLLVLHRVFRERCRLFPSVELFLASRIGYCLRVVITLVCITIGWVLFRASTMAAAWALLWRMVVPTVGLSSPNPLLLLYLVLVVLLIAHVGSQSGVWAKAVKVLPSPIVGIAYACIGMSSLLLAPLTDKAFIYFQF